MNYLLLTVTAISLSAQSVFTKQYGKKHKNTPITFTIMSALSTLAFFVVSSGFSLKFNVTTFIYAFAFAISYIAVLLGLTVALNFGPLSISSLIVNYSLIIPTLFGIAVLSEPVKVTMIIGFVFLVISLFAVNYTKKGGNKFSKKWVIAIIFAFVGNGMCSTVQKLQQLKTGGNYKSEFMIIGLAISFLVLLPIALCYEKQDVASSVKDGYYWAIGRGLANGTVNLIVMILGSRMPISLLFPVVSAGSTVLSSMISVFCYKERLSKLQFFGVAIGIVSIVFLNL